MDISQAFLAYQAGDRDLAAQLCEQIINTLPNSDAYHILGVIQNDQGMWESAVMNLTNASLLDTDNYEIWFNMSLSYRSLGDWDNVLRATYECLSRKNDMTNAWICRAEAFAKLQKWTEVSECWSCLEQFRPVNPESLDIIGVCVLEAQQWKLADRIWNDIVGWFPQNATAWINRSVLHYNQGRYRECVSDCYQAQMLSPRLGWQNMGSAYQAMQEYRMALACYETALTFDPSNYETLSNRCVLLNKLGQNDQAVDSATRSIAVKPDHYPAYNNRGTVYVVQNKIELAERDFEHVLKMQHNNKDARFNLGICKFKQNKWISGWDYWEHRLVVHKPNRSELYNNDIPVYDGSQNLSCKTLLVQHEQGYGDSIQFVRYCRWLHDQDCRVIALVPPQLVPLLSTFPWIHKVQTTVNTQEINFDYQCAMMSIPRAQGLAFTHMPCSTPYLSVNPDRRKHWQTQMPSRHRLKVALAWGGNPQHTNNNVRNIPLAELTPLLKLPVDFICVQNNPVTSAEQQIIDQHSNLWVAPSLFEDFQDTASVIDCCDLTVSVDTSVLHVSGALDKPTWAMLPFASCWRWGSYDTTTTPWYPRMTLFRQAQAQDWISVVQPMSWQLLNML